MKSRILVLALIVLAALGGRALGTPVIGTVTAETARGAFAENLNLKSNFPNGARVGIHTKGPIELIAQRIVAEPGSSFGWHSHPGENVNVVLQGTLTLYHDEHCTDAVEYGPGDAFSTSPEQIHLAHNDGTDTLILYATYFAPLTSPPQAVRIDQPLPSVGCPV